MRIGVCRVSPFLHRPTPAFSRLRHFKRFRGSLPFASRNCSLWSSSKHAFPQLHSCTPTSSFKNQELRQWKLCRDFRRSCGGSFLGILQNVVVQIHGYLVRSLLQATYFFSWYQILQGDARARQKVYCNEEQSCNFYLYFWYDIITYCSCIKTCNCIKKL